MGYISKREYREQKMAEERIKNYRISHGSCSMGRLSRSTRGEIDLKTMREISLGKSPELGYECWKRINRALDRMEGD